MIIYYSVCCLLAFITFRGHGSQLLKSASAIVGVSFLLLVVHHSLWRGVVGWFAYVCAILAGIIFIVGVAKHRSLGHFEKLLFILYISLIVMRLCFRILYMNGSNEMSLLCIGIMVITAAWILYKKFIMKALKGETDVVEVAGLFAFLLFPMFIDLFH